MASLLITSTALAAVVGVGGARAQQGAFVPASATQDTTTGNTTTLGEVIVTAQKRSENVQNVPIAVTAIGGTALAQAGVNDTQQLQNVVPALNYASVSGFAQPYLRGIGSDINVPGAEASVATFVDGVYVEQQEGQIANLLGVDRVEVLAGPQGTLYGRNASGGAISVYTLTPTQKLEAQASGSYGDFNQVQTTAHVSGGIANGLAAGLYIAATRRDSIYDYVAPVPAGQPTIDQNFGIRFKAVWQPIDAIKLTGSIENTYLSADDDSNRNIQSDALGYQFGATPIIENYKVSEDVPQYSKIGITTGILREEANLGFAQLVGITGYRNTISKVNNDLDATNAPFLSLGAPIKSRQFSQEIQLLSEPSSPITWIAGLYYFHEQGGYLPISVNSPVAFQPAPFTTIATSTPEKTVSYAAYAQTTIPLRFITPRLSLTVGGRYTEDQKTKETDTEYFLAGGKNVLPSMDFPGASKTFSKLTPKVSLQYKFNDALAYVTYSQGWKSGTFNNDVATDDTYVKPENLTDYEGGLKTDLLDRRLRLDFAAYYYDLKNLQVQVLDPSNGATAVLRNAAAASAYGLEATAAAAVTHRLKVNFSVALEHSRYDNFPNAPYYSLSPFGNTEMLGVSATGHTLQRAPDFVSTASATYSVPLARGDEIKLYGSVYYNSGFTWDPVGQVKEPDYTLVDASVSYTTPDKQWTGQLWVNNLGDTYHRAFAQVTSEGTLANDALPRMFGFTITWNLR